MISFRYHLVSIIAVFMALALGVVMGTTVVKQGVVEGLKSQADQAISNSHRLQADVIQLQKEVKVQGDFLDQAQPWLVVGQLDGSQVVIVTQQGVEASEIDGIRRVLADPTSGAGAKVLAVIEVKPRMQLADDGARAAMAAAVGGSASDSTTKLMGMAATDLSQRLATGGSAGGSDFLQTMLSAGFLDMVGGSAAPSQIGGTGQALVLLSGGPTQPLVDPRAFMVPLASSLSMADRPVVAAEVSQTVYSFVPVLRQMQELKGRLVTVDDADTVWGRVAVVLGLHNLLADPGHGGDYGGKDGASTLIPSRLP